MLKHPQGETISLLALIEHGDSDNYSTKQPPFQKSNAVSFHGLISPATDVGDGYTSGFCDPSLIGRCVSVTGLAKVVSPILDLGDKPTSENRQKISRSPCCYVYSFFYPVFFCSEEIAASRGKAEFRASEGFLRLRRS